MSDPDEKSKPVASTVTRLLPEPRPEQLPEPETVPLFKFSLSSLKPFPAAPSPPGLADRP